MPRLKPEAIAQAVDARKTISEMVEDLDSIQEEIEKHEGSVKVLKANLRTANQRLLDRLVEENLSGVRLLDGRRAEIWSGQDRPSLFHLTKRAGIPMETAIAALKAAGLDFAVGEQVSMPRLKAHIHEARASLPPEKDAEAALPEALREVFTIYEETRVVVTRAGKKGAEEAPDERNEDVG